MKTIIGAVLIVLFFITGCSKSDNATSSREAFVGSYLMHDTIALQTGMTMADTTITVTSYTMSVLAVSGSSDKVTFSNIGNLPRWDTAIVSGNVASFINDRPAAANATIVGGRITLKGGYVYSNIMNPVVYGIGVGTKQ